MWLGVFYQQALAEEDRDKTTFVCHTPAGEKKFRFRVSCLGLAGAPAAYQSHIEDVLLDIDGVIAYIDDFLYYSNTVEEHLITLERVFERLVKNNIFLHPLKCVWGVTKLNYLGLTISTGLVSVSEEKIAALKAYAIPQGVADVRRYLGFVQYLAVFVPKFAELTAPIQCLLQGADLKKKKWIWTEACQQSFDNTMHALSTAQGLHIANPGGNYVVETDASSIGVAGCLYEMIDGQLNPVWYVSHKFSTAERNYAPRDQEMLAVIYALRKFRSYLLCRNFRLYSNHESLAKFQKDGVNYI